MRGEEPIWALALAESRWEAALVRALTDPALPEGRAGAWPETARVPGKLRRCVDVTELLAVAWTGQAEMAVVDPDFPKLSADVVARLVGAGCAVVAVCDNEAAEDRAGRLGIVDVTSVDPVDCAATARFVRLTARSSRHAAAPGPSPGPADDTAGVTDLDSVACGGTCDGGSRGTVVAVWGPPGAPGRTTLALAIAHTTASRAIRTMVIDADTRAPGVGAALGLASDWAGLVAAASLADRGALTPFSLARQARQVGPSWRVLTGPGSPDGWRELATAGLSAVLRCARELDEFVVVDIGATLEHDDEVLFDEMLPRRDAAALAAAADADAVVAVTSCEPASLARFLTGLPGLIGVTGAPVVPVVNRMRRSLGDFADRGQINGMLADAGLAAAEFIPNAADLMDSAIRRQQIPTESSPRSAFSSAVESLTDRVLGAAAPSALGMAG